MGCGELVALRALPSRTLFLYCDACGSAGRTAVDFACKVPSFFAPQGIEFPSITEVEAAFSKEVVQSRSSSPSLYWEMLAETRLAAGDARSALSIAEEVIATWHQASTSAFEMRERALQAIAAAGGATS